MDVYTPTLQACDIPIWGSSHEMSRGCQTIGLYQPSLEGDVSLVSHVSARPRKLSVAAGAMDLYAPSLPAAVLPELQPQATLAVCHAVDIYAPSLQTAAIPGAKAYEFGGLVDAAYWDEGIGLSGAQNRRFGMVRRSMYAVDRDALAILYDMDPDPVEEPPRELSKVSLPIYRIEPPDLLVIEGIKMVPRPPYHIGVYDVLMISASGTIPNQPIGGYFLVEAEGIVSLGPQYDPIRVVGMTIDEATVEITRKLQVILKQPGVTVQLARSAGIQQVNGIYPVQPDGMVNLGAYGHIYVSGKTVAEASTAVEKQLTEYFDSPEVTVDVMQYNSKNYFIIIAGAESGESILRFPITGNETVLDAISNINGLPYVSSKTMWVARPGPGEMTCQDILPVNYTAIARGGVTDTNYQLLPGDRLYVVDDKLVATGTIVNSFTNPIRRMLNISRLGASVVRTSQTMGRGYNQRRRGL